MSDRIGMRWGRRLGLAVFVGLLGLVMVRPARGDLVFLKDGFVIQGQVKRESTTDWDAEAKEMFTIPKGFFFIDDLPRRIYFTPSLVRVAQSKPLDELVRAVNSKPVMILKAVEMPALEDMVEIGPFDDKWERKIKFRCFKGDVGLTQRLGFLNSYYARMEGTTRLKWSAAYLTSELGPEEVQRLLSSHPDFKETPDLKPVDKAARRFKACDFFVQAGWFDQAERILEGMSSEMPEQKERIDLTQASINQIRGRERFEELKRRHQAGQYELVRKRLEEFPAKEASDKTRTEIAEMKSEYTATQKKLELALAYLDELPRLVTGEDKQAFQKIAETLKEELSPEGLPRLETFMGQAAQARRQREKKQTARERAELLSLAATGWLLGSPAAEGRPARALQLWEARSLVLDYQRERARSKRDTMLSNYLGGREKVSIDEIVQMIPNLPPPKPEQALGPETVEVNLGGQGGGANGGLSYLLRLPREYRHSRTYPVLIVLHREGEKAQEMLERWADAANLNGYILVAPRWQAGMFGGYGYSEREHNSVLYALGDLRRRFSIDSDRVFLFGLGQGGNMAMDVGLSHPDQFAGVMPMGCNPEYFANHYWRNGQFLPFYIVSGSCAGDNEKHIRAIMEKWALMRQYPMLWVQYKGRGVEWFSGKAPNMFDWMRAKRRAFPLRQLGNAGIGNLDGNEYCTMRETDNHYHWLAARGVSGRCQNSAANWNKQVEAARMSARIDPQDNHIYVTARGIKHLTVYIGRNARGDNMIDFDRPVTIHYGVEPHRNWRGVKIRPELGVLLEELYQTGDRQRLFLAALEVPL